MMPASFIFSFFLSVFITSTGIEKRVSSTKSIPFSPVIMNTAANKFHLSHSFILGRNKTDTVLTEEKPNEKKAKRRANRMAIWGFIFSSLSVLTLPYFALPGIYFSIFAIPGLILSLLALKKERKKQNTLTRRNRFFAELGKDISVFLFIMLAAIALFLAFMAFVVFRI